MVSDMMLGAWSGGSAGGGAETVQDLIGELGRLGSNAWHKACASWLGCGSPSAHSSFCAATLCGRHCPVGQSASPLVARAAPLKLQKFVAKARNRGA